MNAGPNKGRCARADDVGLYALDALSASEARELEVHIASCAQCRDDLNALRSVVGSFAAWPKPVLPAPKTSWDQLIGRIEAEPTARHASSSLASWREPEWENVAPGISCKLLSSDSQRDRVAMLVTLAPGTEYPPHTHAGTEELHLLEGELWIDERKLFPGDYNRAVAGTADRRVWSETGCTCLLITSPSDVLS